MHSYELTQKLFAVGATYEVRNPQAALPAVLSTIRGKVFSATPKLSMHDGEGDEAPARATMKGNFTKTKFDLFDDEAKPLGTLSFPMLALKKTFTLATGGQEYKAEGGILAGSFTCRDASGEVVLTITKELALRDKFAVTSSGAIAPAVALLVAVAIDQRFFQDA